jgi:hypothetical protein
MTQQLRIIVNFSRTVFIILNLFSELFQKFIILITNPINFK